MKCETREIRRAVQSIAALGDPGTRPEEVHALPNARVVWMDTNALFEDFPHLERETSAELEMCLLRHAAFASDSQIRQQFVNTPIPISGRKFIAHRPPRYSRALIVSTRESNRTLSHVDYMRWYDEPDGLLDVKGRGVAPSTSPQLTEHGNGLLLLSQAIEEFARQRLIEAVMRHAGVAVESVGIYAILDLGFEGRIEGGKFVPAGALVRRAHLRPIGGVELPKRGTEEQCIKLEIELILRQYGLTSTNHGTTFRVFETREGLSCTYAGFAIPHVDRGQLRALIDSIRRPLPWKLAGVNVQQTRVFRLRPLEAVLVDFGHYEVRKRFEDPLLSLVVDRFVQWGGVPWPDSPQWIQPDPSRAVDPTVAGARPLDRRLAELAGVEEGVELPAEAILGIELAQRWREGGLDSTSFVATVTEYVDAATHVWT